MGGEVKGEAVKACPGGYGGVRGPRAEVVEGNLRCLEEIVPEVRGEVRVGRRKRGDEVIFSRPDTSLRY